MIPVANTRWHRSNLAPDKSRSKSFKHTYFQHFSMLFGTTWPLLSHPASHACVHLWQKQAKNHCVYNIFDSFSEAILGSNMGRTKNVKNATGQIGTVLVSKKMFKTLIFWTLFCYFWALHGICDYVRLHIFQQTNAKNMKKHYVYNNFDKCSEAALRPQDGKTQIWPANVDAKELPRQSHKTLIFSTYFVNFAFRDPCGDRPQCALHAEN